jgi:hypothetical protein
MTLPDGYWGPDRARPILDQTLVYRLESDLSEVTPAERLVIDELLAVGRILDDLHDDQVHHQALSARAELRRLHAEMGEPAETRDLLQLDELFQGPIATTLENELLPFLPVDPWTEGKNVYPWAIERAEIEAWLDAHPEDRDSLLHLHTAVRRATTENLSRDLAALRTHPALDLLHPGLRVGLEARAAKASDDGRGLYAVPYSVAWPDSILEASNHLSRAAQAIVDENRDLAAFLGLRARDLLADDHEAGDAAWIRGELGRLDAVVGAYETYDDDLYGAKGFFDVSLYLRDEPATVKLRAALADLPQVEAAMPYESNHAVRSDIPAGSYDILAAFGGGKTTGAEILPNDPNLMRKYGRKILVRRNLYMHPDSFARAQSRWTAVIDASQHAELTPEGRYEQVVWHEIGHYLGPERARDGRLIEELLQEDAAPIEELKAELASQFAAHELRDRGHLTEADVRGRAAGAILGSLRPVKPLRAQPYPTLWLMEFNWFLDQGLLVYEDGSLLINWSRHAEAVTSMLRRTLEIQDRGSKAEAAAFIAEYSRWDERHERLATQMRSAEKYRFALPVYGLVDGAAGKADGAGASSSR